MPRLALGCHISHHTAEWHLRKVFATLGISSRKQLLRGRLIGAVGTAEPA